MIIDELITDRSESDVRAVEELIEKIAKRTATTEEVAGYLEDMKGAYNASDLNRVGEAVKYLTEKLKKIGVDVNTLGKNDWTEADYVDEETIAYYLKDIEEIYRAIAHDTRMPQPPQSISNLTADAANRIEKILVVQNETIDSIKKVITPSGLYSCGSVGCTK